MARPIDYSLKYFPLNTNMYDDSKVLLAEEIVEQNGVNSDYVFLFIVKMYSWIYGKDGYCIKWDDRMSIVYSKKEFRHISSQDITIIVNALIDVGIFDKKMYQEYNILTSYGIQKRFKEVIALLKRKARIPDKHLINSSVTELIQEETTAIQEETTAITDVSTLKERKGNEIYNNNNKGEKFLVEEVKLDEEKKPDEEKAPPVALPPLKEIEDMGNINIHDCAVYYKQHPQLEEKRYLVASSNNIYRPGTTQVNYELLNDWVDCWIRWRVRQKKVSIHIQEFITHFARWLYTKDKSVNPLYENRFDEEDNQHKNKNYNNKKVNKLPDSNDGNGLKEHYNV